MDQNKLDIARSKIIVAMDVPLLTTARNLAAKLKGHVGMYKVGKQLFTAYGPKAVKACGGDVFLDLKYFDIPTTVALAGIEAAKLGVAMFNMHALGGEKMMTKTVTDLHEKYPDPSQRPKILAVTILTSLSDEDLKKSGINMSTTDMVMILAMLAKKCGVDGVVASPQETKMIRELCGSDFIITTPGIRMEDGNIDDQKRIATPRSAILNGANLLVIGRPITEAKDPVAAADRIAEEIAAVL